MILDDDQETYENGYCDGYRAGLEAATKVVKEYDALVGFRLSPNDSRIIHSALSYCMEIIEIIEAKIQECQRQLEAKVNHLDRPKGDDCVS